MDIRKIPEADLMETIVEDGIETRIYQMQLLHREFHEPLNVVTLLKINLETKAWAHVILPRLPLCDQDNKIASVKT